MYANSFLTRVWNQPGWVRYLTAALSSLVAAGVRILMEPFAGDRMQFLFFSFAVCIAAFVGGIGPGVLCSILSVVLATELLPRTSPSLGPTIPSTLIAFIALWLFISLVCDVLRKAALGLRVTAQQRDEKDQVLNAVLRQTTDGLLTVDHRGTITLANEAVGEMLAVEEAAVVGASINYLGKFLHDAPDWAELAQQAQEEGRAIVDVETIQNRWLNMRFFPSQDHGCSVFMQDITIRKNLEFRQLEMLAAERSARSKAEEANRLKDSFLAMLSHELRTPLTSILGWTELLTPLSQKEPMLKEGLAAILKSTLNQKSLIDQLLDMSRITTGKMAIERHLVDVADVVSEVVNSLRPMAAARDIPLDYTGPEEPCYLVGDETRLIQVFNNLITNAIKFSLPSGRVSIRVEVHEKDAVRITVKDEGEGIPLQLLPIIFDPFQQADSSITRRHGGLGLGLALAKQLTLQHDGKITAHSDGPGTGSTFQVVLPTKGADEATLKAAEMQPTEESLKGIVLLLVEDDELTRGSLRALLSKAGAVVIAVESGLRALDVLQTDPVNIILSDIGMPMMDGYELLRRVRAHTSPQVAQLPALSLSAFAFKEDMELAKQAGFNACLTKPVNAGQLVHEINVQHSLASRAN